MRNSLLALWCLFASMPFMGGCHCNGEELRAIPPTPTSTPTPEPTPSPLRNACGGTARLAHSRGEACTRVVGECEGYGVYECRGRDRVQCTVTRTVCPELTPTPAPTPVIIPTPIPTPDCSIFVPQMCGRYEWDESVQRCSLVAQPAGFPCDDGNLCTVNDQCDGMLFWSQGCNLGTERDCATELAPRECNILVCVSTLGCQYEQSTGWEPCDDGRYCTQDDSCSNGSCRGVIRSCTDPLRQCADMTCDETRDTCVARSRQSGERCNDGDACTLFDHCDGAYNCVGSPRQCDDDNVCTANSCDHDFGCQTRYVQGASCDDGDQCTEVDRCVAGGCVGTDKPNGTSCDDSQFCTDDDVCQFGFCRGTLHGLEPRVCLDLVCEDLVTQCTDEFCDEQNERYVMTFKADGVLCRDNVFCTVNDRCQAGICESGLQRDCAAGPNGWGDQCNQAFCNEERQTCDSTPVPASQTCDDGDICTTGDYCAGPNISPGSRAACVPTAQVDADDHVDCTVDRCDPVLGTIHTPNDARCNNGAWCVTPMCDIEQGCVYTPLPDNTPCDDGTVCTQRDMCMEGTCVTEGDVTSPDGLRKIGWLQGPHYLWGPNVGQPQGWDYNWDDVLCHSGFDILILESADRVPVCANSGHPLFVKYMSLTVRHHGIYQCYDAALVAQYTVGDDPHGGPDDPNGNAVPEPVLDIRAPAVRNMILNRYLPCLLQYDRNPGPDGFLVDTLGSLYDEFSYLAPAAVSLMGEIMDRYPRFMFLINDGWNVNWVAQNGVRHNAWDDIMDMAVARRRDMTFIFESFYLDFEGQPQYVGNGIIRPGLPLDLMVRMRMRRDAAPAYIRLATLEHPPVDDNQNACFLNGEATCYAWLHGMSPIVQQYYRPRPWCHWDPGLNTFVVNGDCSDALMSPLPSGDTCMDGSTH